MPGYFRGGFGKLKGGPGGFIRLRAPLNFTPPPVIPVVGGYYVAANGNDANDGASATPFATISRALAATRGGAEKRIFLRGGTYRLTSKISLTGSDAGTSFTAYPGETPVITSGEVLTGFVDEGDGIYSVPMASPIGLDLFVGATRYRPGQSGFYSPSNPYRSGWLIADAVTTSDFTNEFDETFEVGVGSAIHFRYREGEVPSGIFQAGLVAQVFNADRTADFITTVASIDTATRTITLTDPHFSGPIQTGSAFRLMLHPNFLLNNGEFAWRSSDNRLLVRPPNPAFEGSGVAYPKLNGLFDLQSGANDISFTGITFSEAQWNGYAVSLNSSHRAKFGGCVFRNTGDAIRSTDSLNGKVGGCTFSDLASSGVTLNSGSASWKIYANRFVRMGLVNKTSSAVICQGTIGTTIAFNDIQYTPRYGMAFRGGGSHRVISNKIVDTGNETAGSAGIEFFGKSASDQSSLIEGNYIDRVPGSPMPTLGEFSSEFNGVEFNVGADNPREQSVCISLNDFASNITVRNNFTRGASFGHFVVHGGSRNSIENNVSILDEYDNYYAVVRSPYDTPVDPSPSGPWTPSGQGSVINGTPSSVTLVGSGTGTLSAEKEVETEQGDRFVISFTTDQPVTYTIKES